jgi:type IV pilus assembly protein PilB
MNQGITRKQTYELLVERKIITKDELDNLFEEGRRSKQSIEHLLVEKGLLNEKDLAQFLGAVLNIPFVDLNNYILDSSVLNTIPEKAARKYVMVPLFKVKDKLTVAISDPWDILALDEAKMLSGCIVQPVLSTSTDIIQVIEQYYSVSDSIEQIVKDILQSGIKFVKEEQMDVVRLQRVAVEPPVVKLVNLILAQALKDRASDIHIEPEEEHLRIRFRIDGILHSVLSLPRDIHLPVIPRIKIIANLDIVERRRPQDGRFRIMIEAREVDLRVSSFPVAFGEKVVIRVLEKEVAFLGLDKLGFSEDILPKFERLIKKSNGIILVTGPTGSGKTTTLYSILDILNSTEKNVVTLEDPREYLLPGINQGEVNPDVELDFASGLRSILRQDPDIIMIGEVRDFPTAEISIRAALTGHLVLSTLHTNDAAGAIARLIDMRIEPFLISSSLVGVLAQRLVRRICNNCKEKCSLDVNLLKQLGAKGDFKGKILFKGRGCTFCRHTGYRGRIGIFELMPIDNEIKSLIMKRVTAEEIKQVAKKKGMKTLREDGLDKVFEGITTLEEVMKITQD